MSNAVEKEAVRFEEATEFLRRKLALPSEGWTDLWEAMHSVAFVVAGAQTEALVTDFHKAVTRAIEEGRTLADFRADFDRIVALYGWQYRGTPGWRSRVIFETNLRMAYAAGRWAQIQRLKHVRPWLRYVTADDERVRPEHKAWHNLVLSVDDPWWLTHFPPCGWGCRCRAVSLSDRDLLRYRLTPADAAPEIRYVAQEIRTPSGPVTVRTPEGIDPGFGYNPGLGRFGGAASLKVGEGQGFRPLTAPGREHAALDALPLDKTETAAGPAGDPSDPESFRAAFREVLGGLDEVVLTDPTGAGIRLGMAIVDHILESPKRMDGRERYLTLLPALVQDPAEIWIGFAEDQASGKVAMRRRYVRLFDLGRETVVGLVADTEGRDWVGLTFFRGKVSGAKALRSGLRIWKRGLR